jgi:hypothetical protein
MELFRTEPPFIIRIFYDHFIITWDGSVEVPEDIYHYSKVRSVTVRYGKKDKSFSETIIDFLFKNRIAERIETYDDLVINFKDGNNEIRYINGPATPAIHEAVDMINEKLVNK